MGRPSEGQHTPDLEGFVRRAGAYTIHQVAWVMCMVEMQPEENCAAITERASAAALDYDTIGLLLGSRA